MQGYLQHCCVWCLLFRQASEHGENLALWYHLLSFRTVLICTSAAGFIRGAQRLCDDSQVWVCRNEPEVLSKPVCCMV